jgi:DNA-directed RNA polymerase specialized sigma subunit
MSAKDYLKQIKDKREYIHRLELRRKGLYDRYCSIRATDYVKDRVQSSPVNSLEENAVELAERTQEIDMEIIRVTLQIDDVLNKIDSVGSIYSQILSMQYDEGKRLQQIADELKIGYNYLCQLNGEALRRLTEQLNKSN